MGCKWEILYCGSDRLATIVGKQVECSTYKVSARVFLFWIDKLKVDPEISMLDGVCPPRKKCDGMGKSQEVPNYSSREEVWSSSGRCVR